MSTVYASKAVKRAKHRQRMTRRRLAVYTVMIVVGLLMVIGAGFAWAAVILHGRGTLDAPAVQQKDLQVSNTRLDRPLLPGGTADLLFSVRNPNAFGARVDQVSLVGALRKANPAGCTAKVAGPVTRSAGYRLPSAEQVLVGAGAKKDVVVHAAFTLAGSAKTGCGFTAEVDVSATQLTPTASPTTVNPTTAPTSTPTDGAGPGVPVTSNPTTPPTTTPTMVSTTDLTPPTTPSSVNCGGDLDPC